MNQCVYSLTEKLLPLKELDVSSNLTAHTKRCSKCKIDKSISEFGKNSSKKDGLQSACNICRKTANREYYKKTPDLPCRKVDPAKKRAQHLKSRYGLSVESYSLLLEMQDNKCAICLETFNETPHVDHNHKCCSGEKITCGKCVRGLLCAKCNLMIGFAERKNDIIFSAAKYLGLDTISSIV